MSRFSLPTETPWRLALFVFLLSGVLLLEAPTAWGQQPSSSPLYLDSTRSVEARVQDLLSRMTLEEKVAQIQARWLSYRGKLFDDQGRFRPDSAEALFPHGIGEVARPSERQITAIGSRGPRELANYTNRVQRWFVEETRLGIPVLFHEEALHGLNATGATSYPQAIALTGTWNPELMETIYTSVAAETRSRGAQHVLSPVVDIVQDPRWGRTGETLGEDPYLAAQIGMEMIRGFQGAGPGIGEDHVMATLKHMAGHGTPEGGMNVGTTHMGERELREMLLFPFEAAIKKAGAGAVMASYNEVDGIPSHANRHMLGDILRGEWGFNGIVVSDYGAIGQLHTLHRVAGDLTAAGHKALQTGVDIELPDPNAYPKLVEEVRAGRVDEALVDTAAARILRAKFRLGLFEDPYVDPDRAERVAGRDRQEKLALRAARQALTLLTNDGVLPLTEKSIDQLAVIGPHAGEALLGGYSGKPPRTASPLEGLRTHLGEQASVQYAEGVRITEDSTFTDATGTVFDSTRSVTRWRSDPVVRASAESNARRRTKAVQVARNSDVAVLVLGGNEATGGEAWSENHLRDRASLEPVGPQAELVRAVKETGTPTIVLVQGSRPLAIGDIASTADAVLQGWYLGQEGGHALADVLFGKVDPGGRLPVTMPRSAGHLRAYHNHKPSARRGYLFSSAEPLFPFGHGLSYTSFAYSDLQVAPKTVQAGDTVRVEVRVENTGDRAGTEVVQLYTRDVISSVTKPVKELSGFKRVRLEAGAAKTVTFHLPVNLLGLYDRDMNYVVEPGTIEVRVARSAANVQLEGTFEIGGETQSVDQKAFTTPATVR
ncbi:MAG: glycoside hydrolase family 3 N-terminal domain-containing protein [Salinibacter sp.]